MSGFTRWVADGMPSAGPGLCRRHQVPETVMAGAFLSQAGQEDFPYEVCPRCGFEDPNDMLTSLWAVHDGSTWHTDDVCRRFQHAWLAQTRAEGYDIPDLTAGLDPDAAPPDDTGRWPLFWAFRVLNPGVTQDEAERLYSSTTIHRRRGCGHDDLGVFPYTDLAALRALSAGVLSRWETYHAALWAELGPEDRARVLDVDFNALHGNGEWEPSDGSDRTQSEHMPVFGAAVTGYVERLLAAHHHVVGPRGITAPTHSDRFQCYGDVCGDLGMDVALGLRRWRLGPR